MTARLSAATLRRRAQKVRLLLMDVDGVLTNGHLFYVPDGRDGIVEAKAFNSHDGMAMRWMQEAGVLVGWISGRESPGVVARAQILQIAYLYQNHLAKLGPYEEILKRSGLGEEEVCYIGDDLTDAPVMKRVGLAVAVANAARELKGMAHYVTRTPGGSGAVREVVEVLLRAQNQWNRILDKYGVNSRG